MTNELPRRRRRVYNVYTGEPAGSAVPTAAQTGAGAAAVLCRLRPPDDRAGAAGRVVGEVLAARVVDSKDLETQRVSDADGAGRRAAERRRRCRCVIGGLRRRGRARRGAVGVLAPPVHGGGRAEPRAASGSRRSSATRPTTSSPRRACWSACCWWWRWWRRPALAVAGAPRAGDGRRPQRRPWRRCGGSRGCRRGDRRGCVTARSIRRRAGVTRAPGALRHRGARGVLRALAAAGRGDDAVPGGRRGAGVRG